MPKSPPRRNATEVEKRRILKGITAKNAGQIVARAVAGAWLDPKYKNPPNPLRTERAR
jgi:hypothetical protein